MNDFIERYESPVTKRNISINTNLEDYVWLNKPSSEDLREMIVEYEEIRINEAWDWFCSKRNDAEILEGFHQVAFSLYFLQARQIKPHLPGFTQKRYISQAVRGLSLDEQRRILRAVQPQTRADLEKICTVNGALRVLGEDFLAMLDEAGDPDRFLTILAEGTKKPDIRDFRAGKFARHIEVLCLMRARDWVLFPMSYANLKKPVKWETASNPRYVGDMADRLKELAKYVTSEEKVKADTFINYANVVFLMTDAQEIDDLSQPLIERIDQMAEIVLATKDRSKRGRLFTRAFHTIWNHRNPAHAFAAPTHRNSVDYELRRTSGAFGWVRSKYPLMEGWVKPLADYIASRRNRGIQAPIADLNHFIEFIGKHPKPPGYPMDVVRHVHIYDATQGNRTTYLLHLEAEKIQRKRASRMLRYVREFFDWMPDWLHANGQADLAKRFVNPISIQDKFKSRNGENPGQTFRTALPSWLLKELRSTIESDDFAFMKSFASQDWINVLDRETEQLVRVWWPGTSVCLLVMLELPLRSHQARWLDSGELDEFLVDDSSMKEVKNPNEFAIKKRRQGCMRIIHDSLRQETWTGLFVNTNKTSLYDGNSPVGYEIPYLPPRLAERLTEVKAWGERYLPPLHEPVRYNSIGERAVRRKEILQKVPMVAPLFRYAGSNGDTREPVARVKLVDAYVQVLAETERRVKEKYGVDISLTEVGEKGELRWKYDLHTLRVSGISAMIENGVPLEVVSQFVAGHASLVMTLWYLRNSPGKLREAIEKAQSIAEQEGDFVGGEGFIEHIEKFAPFLLSKDDTQRELDEDVALSALFQHVGLWTINSDGICPGTSCATGGELDGVGNYGPVPGGRRCGLCRYWLTGPAFILGQVAEVNNLAYRIQHNGRELAEQRDKLIDLEDAGKLRESHRLRQHIEALERDLTLDITEWQARYQYAMASSNLLDEYAEARRTVSASERLPAPLLTASSTSELKLTLQATDQFVLIEHVTQMCDFLPSFNNREAVHEKHWMLSKILEVNGLPQFLLKLDDRKAQNAANLLSSLILKYVQAQDMPRVISGDLRLENLPGLEEEVRNLAEATNASVLPSAKQRKIIPIRQVGHG